MTDQSQPTAPRWGLGDAFAGFAAGIVLSGIIASVWLAAHKGAKDLSLGGQGLAEIGLWVGLAGSCVVAARLKGSGRISEDFGFRGRPSDLGLGLVVGVLAQAVMLPVIALVLRPLLGNPKVSGPVQDLIDAAHGPGLVVLILFVAVGAPVVEELFFRGLVLRSLSRRFGDVPAIVMSGILFGLAHPQPLSFKAQVLVMVSLAALGVVLATLAVRTGRLGPTIVAHATFNAWTLVVLLAH